MIMRYRRCPTCDGSGMVWNELLQALCKCPDCQGDGLLEEEYTENDRITQVLQSE